MTSATLKEYSDLRGIPYNTVSSFVSNHKLSAANHLLCLPPRPRVFLVSKLDDLFKDHKPNLTARKPRQKKTPEIREEAEYSKTAPFRNIKCPKYWGCMTAAATQKKDLVCENCENRNAESQDWLENEMAC